MRHWKNSEQGAPVLASHTDSLGDLVWGYFALDDYVTTRDRHDLARPLVRAFQRWNEVKRLMKHRVAAGQTGWKDAHGWIAVISNILLVTQAVTKRGPTVKHLEWFCGLMKMPPFEHAAYPFVNDSEVLLSARAAGMALHLTKEERAVLKIRTIDAEDELKRDRERRLNKEAAARARLKKGVMPRSESMTAKAKALGISLSTYKRRLAGVNRIRHDALD
ncbi:MAG TPA: hypothetical protein VIL30_20265 [Ramlibacter sp.]